MLVGLLVLSLLCSAAGCTSGSKTDEGYWVITAYREEGETYKGDELPKIGMDGYLVLEKGGSGFLVISGSGAYEITWGDGKIEGSRFGLDYTRSGSTLTANGRRTDDMEGVVFTFEKSKDAAPARPAGLITAKKRVMLKNPQRQRSRRPRLPRRKVPRQIHHRRSPLRKSPLRKSPLRKSRLGRSLPQKSLPRRSHPNKNPLYRNPLRRSLPNRNPPNRRRSYPIRFRVITRPFFSRQKENPSAERI